MAVSAIHPGEHLAEELQALDMSAGKLARKIGVPTNRATDVVFPRLARSDVREPGAHPVDPNFCLDNDRLSF